MTSKESVIEEIRSAFRDSEYPGDDYLQGSHEGSEPSAEIDPFKGKQNWESVPPQLLDRHYAALTFFSEAGLRFFLPAYLIADIKGELETADPLFTLVHGFFDIAVEHRIGDQVFIRKSGESAFINPRRYGGMRFYDYARYRLSIFTREEVKAIVVYLSYKKGIDPVGIRANEIDAALDSFWNMRLKLAPSKAEIEQYLLDEDLYLKAIISSGKYGS
jgi:hypothetical protein